METRNEPFPCPIRGNKEDKKNNAKAFAIKNAAIPRAIRKNALRINFDGKL